MDKGMKRHQDANETPITMGIIKSSGINQPTRTTGYTSAIGMTGLDMPSVEASNKSVRFGLYNQQ